MSKEPDKPPQFDWLGQLRYLALILVAVVAVLALLRFLGLRG